MPVTSHEPFTNESLLRLFEERGALLQGHFLLTSGLHSPRYLQCARVLMDPALATRLCAELAGRLRPLLGGKAPGAVVAPALGGVLVAHEVARALGGRGLFTERQDGAMTLRRGFTLEAAEPVVVVEDVITTGGSTREVMDAVEARGALLQGHFLLTSGLHSPRYLQCARVLMDPALATRLGADLAGRLRPLLGGKTPGAVVAPALGGVLVAHEVARAFGCRGLFTERQDGAMTLRRGFTLEAGEPVVVVEDVITTGGSTREVMDAVITRGARVVAVGSLVDRSGGKVDLGVPRRSLLELEVPTYAADACPLCAAGSKPEKPGSRAAR